MGSAAARHLAEAGEDVLVVGPDEPADPVRHTGPFASHYDEGRQAEYSAHSEDLSRLARASTNSYSELEKRTGISFYRDHPNLIAVPSDWKSDYLDPDRCLAIAKVLGEKQIPLDDDELRARFPMFRFSPSSRGLLEPHGGIINPRDLVRAQLAAARAAGATLVADDVVALHRMKGGVGLETRGGLSLQADRVLVAAGGFSNVAELLERKLALHLSGVTVVLVEAPAVPRPEIPSVTFVLRSEVGPRVGFAMPPLRYPDGRFYLKCATGSSVDTVLTEETLLDWFRGPGLPGDAEQVVGLLHDVLPDFEPGLVRSLPCMVSYTRTGLPYIDRLDERTFVAAGCNAIGVMTSDAIGRMAAAMVREAAWPGPIAAEKFRAQLR
jgi:sarcosine oxidase